MGKRHLAVFFVLFLMLPFCKLTGQEVKEYTLENGLKVFLMEDISTPLVRIEVSCKAGVSAQTTTSAGFFELYSRIIAASMPEIPFSEVYCGTDSSRFVVSTPAFHSNNYLDVLAEGIFSPFYSDDLLEEEFLKLKEEIKLRSKDATFILNGAIDSRVFAATPWKVESGIIPELFCGVSVDEAKNILKVIGNRWYTPQNSAVFISGNFEAEKVLPVVEECFGRYYSNTPIPGKTGIKAGGNRRNFVFSSGDFSKDLVQVVLQYTSLNYEETEILAEMLNKDYSSFKSVILENTQLGIPGAEYINIAAAHKGNSSRLIVQTIFQKNPKLNSQEQVGAFVDLVNQGILQCEETEFFDAKRDYEYSFNRIKANSVDYMNRLAEFWSREDYLNFEDEYVGLGKSSLTEFAQTKQVEKIKSVELSEIKTMIQFDVPFVFVLTNSNDYKKNKAAYSKKGFDEITEKNAWWYLQKDFKEKVEAAKNDGNLGEELFGKSSSSIQTRDDISNLYFQKNREAIKKHVLENGIDVNAKFNGKSSDVSILLSIQGGEIISADEPGMEEVMVILLAGNIQKELYRQQLMGMIIGSPTVDYDCQKCTSYILVDCDKSDFSACCRAISNALVYEEIMPSSADRAVSMVQYNKRIENAALINQLYGEAAKILYEGSDLAKLYTAGDRVLEKVSYQKILEEYPELLDAGRYSVILAGNYDSNYLDVLNKTLGTLPATNIQKKRLVLQELQGVYPENKQIPVKLVHKFYADPTLDKNAPMPAILIPTKDFYDPSMFVLKIPEVEKAQLACFDAMFIYLNKLNISESFYLIPPDSQTDFAAIVIQNVNTKTEAKAVYRKLILELQRQFLPELAEKTVQAIKDNWVCQKMEKAVTNSGTAELLQKGYEYCPYEKAADFYLMEYNAIQKADVQTFVKLLDYFSADPAMELYSTEAKN